MRFHCKAGGKFTASGTTVGELFLWSVLRDLDSVGCKPAAALPAGLKQFYEATAKLPGVVKCVEEKTAFGELGNYLVVPPTL
eukprot:SAG22_NODE_1637_length_3917_cov_1.975642_2_plen_82_part_00